MPRIREPGPDICPRDIERGQRLDLHDSLHRFVAATACSDDNNPWPLYLSVPVLIFICCYSLTKRFGLCVAGGLAAAFPVATWIAIVGMER